MAAPVPSAGRPGSATGLPQWSFRWPATNVPQPAAQLSADAHDTTPLPFLSLARTWSARPHRPFTSLTTNGGRPPPAAQLPRADELVQFSPESALPEMFSSSANAFPAMSRAVLV